MPLPSAVLDLMRFDLDRREEIIREAVYETLAKLPAPDLSEHLVASYFVHARTLTPAEVGREVWYHMTSGIRKPPPGTLLAECTGVVVDSVNYDAAQRIGVVRVAFPLKMLRDEAGKLYSTDILHIVGGAGAFALTENLDIKLVDIAMSDKELRAFPGPAYGAPGVRRLTNLPPGEVAFGTILKPCTGITPDEEARIVAQAAANPLFIFVKEDENFMPRVTFAPLARRLEAALAAVRRVQDRRGDRGLIYAPHVTATPHLLGEAVQQAVEAGARGVMFSEYYAEGCVRLVREMTQALPNPPAIYGHNGGIDCRTRHIYREVLDTLARLDGVDFRQTAPLTNGPSLLRPCGLEWRKCEEALSAPLAGHAPVMMARAGGLDQGNIIPNLLDVTARGGSDGYLFLAGSAINGIKNARGEYDPTLGAEAMRQAVDLFRSGDHPAPGPDHPAQLKAQAESQGLKALATALKQRYGL